MFRNNWYRDVQAEMSKKPDTEIPWERPDFKGGRVPEQQLKPVELFLIEDKREIQRALALGASELSRNPRIFTSSVNQSVEWYASGLRNSSHTGRG